MFFLLNLSSCCLWIQQGKYRGVLFEEVEVLWLEYGIISFALFLLLKIFAAMEIA